MAKKASFVAIKVIFFLSLVIALLAFSQMISAEKEVAKSLEFYNESLSSTTENPVMKDNFAKNAGQKTNSENGRALTSSESLYQKYPEKGEVFGKVTIPELELELPILHGTDQEELAKGVGHYIGSVFPGEQDNTVLAGHRDTVFSELGDLTIGDVVHIDTAAGRFTYKIESKRIVDKNDRSVIVPYDKAVLTMITCYPFDFIGPAPDRYVLVGKLIKEKRNR